MNVSIVIIYREENPYLFECLDHCKKLKNQPQELILVPNNAPSQKLLDVVKDMQPVKIVPSGPKNIPQKRNIGVNAATGDIIAFIDDDAYPDVYWLQKALPYFSDQTIGAVGGPNLTPHNDPFSRQIAGNVLKTEVAFGKGYIRNCYCPEQFVLELPTCNLLVRKSLFETVSFDESLAIGEDDKLCVDITNKGLKILYSPDVVVYHHRRKIFLPFLKQFFYYGLFNGKLMRSGKKHRWYYLVPSAFLFFVIIGFFASWFHPLIAYFYISIITLYALATLIGSIRNAKTYEIPVTWLVIFLAQMSYGIGFMIGLVKK